MVAFFVLIIFLSVLAIDMVVLHMRGKYHPAFEPSYNLRDKLIFDKSNFIIPSELFFSKGHTWLRKNDDGIFDIGIDSFGAVVLGTMPILMCADEGIRIKRGEILLEAGKGDAKIRFLSPVSGIIKAVNNNLIGNKIPDAYATWRIKLIPEDFAENGKMFLSGSRASAWMKKEFGKLKEFIDNRSPLIESAGVTMYDGGTVSDDAVSSLVINYTNEFEIKFLSL